MGVRYLRETAVKDVLDIISAIANKNAEGFFKGLNKNGAKYNTSIANSSKDLIMSFPVICSNTINVKTATMISKAIERKNVTMLQMLFASQCITSSRDAVEFISQFHKNIDMGQLSVDEFITLADTIQGELNSSKLTKDIFTKGSIFEDAQIMRAIKEDMEVIKRGEKVFPLDSVNERSIQDFRVRENYGKLEVYEVTHEADREDTTKNKVDFFKKQLQDSDAKKANELVPSLMIIKYVTDAVKNGEPISGTAVVGVKSRLVPVDSFEIIDKIFVKHNDKNGLLKLIRATTREISFTKDFLLAIDKAKVDALSRSRKGSVNPIWKVLERRALNSNINKALRRANDAAAITSLVITQDEADYMAKNYNINLENPVVVREILSAYNLLCFVIVDESIEVAKFLYDDGAGTYETLSFNSLEREAGDGGMYKKVINLMTKMNR